MAKRVQLRRGTTAQHTTFVGAEGEVTVDTTKKTLVLHDGVTAGGKPLPTLEGGLVPVSQLPSATTTVQGAVILNNTLTSTNTNQALTAAQGKVLSDQDFGVGQSWQNVTASRALFTTYINSTGKPIQVSVVVRDSSSINDLYFFVSNVLVVSMVDLVGGSAGFQQITITVPSTQTYRLETANLLHAWSELR